MKKVSILLLTVVLLVSTVAPASASGPTGTVGIYSVAACQDTTTVTVSGTASAATNRIKGWLYKQNDKGEWIQLGNTVVTGNFNSGDFIMPLVFDYFGNSVEGGTPLQVVVKLQSQSGSSLVDVSSTSTIVNASDKSLSEQVLADSQHQRFELPPMVSSPCAATMDRSSGRRAGCIARCLLRPGSVPFIRWSAYRAIGPCGRGIIRLLEKIARPRCCLHSTGRMSLGQTSKRAPFHTRPASPRG